MLTLEHVSKSYGKGGGRVQVVRDVSLAVAAGETVWLRGPSGSGKSSLIRIAGLLSRPDEGRVAIEGKDVLGEADEVRRSSIGIVFQQSNLLPDLTVVENVLIATRKGSRAEVLERLAAFGLQALADRPAKQISGGEAQRVAFCRALVNDPVVLLADEPTSGLDDDNAELVRQQLVQARARGRAILVASHDPRTEAVADRVLVMKDGSLV